MNSIGSITRIKEIINHHLPEGSLRARMAKGTFWFLCGTLAIQVSAMLSGIFSARILGQTGYGELNLLRTTVLMFGVLAGTGLGVLAIKYVSEFRDTKPQRAGRLLGLLFKVSLTTGLIVSALSFILADPLATYAMESPELATPLRIGSILLLLNTLTGVQTGAICGFESFRVLFKINMLDGILILVLVPLGAYLAGVNGAIGGFVLAAMAGLIVKQIFLNFTCHDKGVSINFKWDKTDVSEIGRTMVPIFVLGVAFHPFEWLAKLILARQTNGFAQLGLFAAASSFGTIVSLVPSQLVSTTQPLLGNLLGKKDTRSFKRLAFISVLLSGFVALFIALGLSLFSNLVMSAYGADFIEAGSVLVVISFANIFVALVNPYYKILITFNKVWTQAIITMLLGTTLVATTYYFRARGASGLAISYLIAYLFMFAIQTGIIFITLKRAAPTPKDEKRPSTLPSMQRLRRLTKWRPLTSALLRRMHISNLFKIRLEETTLLFHPAAIPMCLWEDRERYLDDRKLFRRYLREGDVCVDAGANVGLLTAIASKQVGSEGFVISVEAHPRTYRFLTENLKLNNTQNVNAVNTALGATMGKLNFSDEVGDDINHVLVNSAGLSVPVTTLDSLTGELDEVDLLKLDVEGYELEVLKGASRTLSISRCIYFESYDAQFQRYDYCAKDLITMLNEHGFSIYFPPGEDGLLKPVPEGHCSPYVENLIAVRDVRSLMQRTGYSHHPQVSVLTV